MVNATMTMKVLLSILLLLCRVGVVECGPPHDNPSSSSTKSWIGSLFHRKHQDASSNMQDGFEILDEQIVYSGWRTVVQRKVRMRNGKIVDFDLIGVKTGDNAVLIFAWDTKTKTATLVREYMPASHKILFGISAGLVEAKHNDSVLQAAHDELEEEAQLIGGTWIPLSASPSAMDKYSLTTVHAFLVLDPTHAENPKPRDAEEDIEVVSGITIPEIMKAITTGNMNLVSAWGCMLAIEKLREMGEYP